MQFIPEPALGIFHAIAALAACQRRAAGDRPWFAFLVLLVAQAVFYCSHVSTLFTPR